MIDSKSKGELSVLYGQKEIGDSYVSFRIDLLEITAKYRDKLLGKTHHRLKKLKTKGVTAFIYGEKEFSGILYLFFNGIKFSLVVMMMKHIIANNNITIRRIM